MKKNEYIQPTIEVETMECCNIMAGTVNNDPLHGGDAG